MYTNIDVSLVIFYYFKNTYHPENFKEFTFTSLSSLHEAKYEPEGSHSTQLITS